MELTDYIRILRKSWILIVLATLLGVGVAAAYSLTRTPIYVSSSTVFVSTQAGGDDRRDAAGVELHPVARDDLLQPRDDADRDEPRDRQARSRDDRGPARRLGLGIQPAQHDAHHDHRSSTRAPWWPPTSRMRSRRASPTPSSRSRRRTARRRARCGSRASRMRSRALTPSSPNVTLNLVLGGLIGLALGIGVAVLRSVLDTRIRTSARHRTRHGSPDHRRDRVRPDAPRIGRSSCRTTRAAPAPSRSGHCAPTCSSSTWAVARASSSPRALPSEGKSTSTINLAIALADAGKRVALHRRRPAQAEGGRVSRHRGRRGAHRRADRSHAGRRRHAPVGRPQPVRASGRQDPAEPERAARLEPTSPSGRTRASTGSSKARTRSTGCSCRVS